MQDFVSFLEYILPFMQGVSFFEAQALWAVLIVALVAIVYALVLRSQVMKQAQGAEPLQAAGALVAAGGSAYLHQQRHVIAMVAVVLAALLAASVWFVPPTPMMLARFGEEDAAMWAAIARAVACLVGALLAAVAGFVGMRLAVAASTRMVAAASKGYPQALQVAYGAGTVPGLLTTGLGLLGSTLLLMICGTAAPDVLPGFVLGATVVALMMHAGGGIYTTATDASTGMGGSDAIAPTTQAAVLVGGMARDNGGTTTDAFESSEMVTLAALLAGLVLGDGLRGEAGDGLYDLRFFLFPLMLRGIGLVAVLIGNALVRTDEKRRNALAAMNRGLYLTAALAVVGVAALTQFYMANPTGGVADWRPFVAFGSGVLLVLVLDRLIRYFTATTYTPVKALGQSAQGGTAPMVMSGTSLGFDAGIWALLVLVVPLPVAIALYAVEPEASQLPAIFYGVALAGLGVLTPAGNLVAIGSTGALAESARRTGHMVGLEKNPRNVLEDMDAVGGISRTAVRSIAMGAAALAVVALVGALLAAGPTQRNLSPLVSINIARPEMFAAFLFGAVLPLLALSHALRSTLRAATQLVRMGQQQTPARDPEQQSDPPPDAGPGIRAATRVLAQDVVSLAVIVVLAAVLVGMLAGAEALAGMLSGMLVVALPLALVHLNAGGAWDNARRYIEDGFYGGKNSVAHTAVMVGSAASGPLHGIAGAVPGALVKLTALAVLVLLPVLAAMRVALTLADPIWWAVVTVCLLGVVGLVWHGRRPVQPVRPAGAGERLASRTGARRSSKARAHERKPE